MEASVSRRSPSRQRFNYGDILQQLGWKGQKNVYSRNEVPRTHKLNKSISMRSDYGHYATTSERTGTIDDQGVRELIGAFGIQTVFLLGLSVHGAPERNPMSKRKRSTSKIYFNPSVIPW